MVGVDSPDLPKRDSPLLVNLQRLIGELTDDLQSLSPEEYQVVEGDLKRLERLLTVAKYRQSVKHESPGSVQVKYVNNCGPYGYLVISNRGKAKWEYLGKDVDGVGVGYYPAGTPMRFKKRSGVVHVGDWSGKRIRDDSKEE